jgi:glucokinase-like ROK family protein
MPRRYRTGDQALVREINLSTVMRCLHDGEPLSRAQLAGLTGLNKTTVSSLIEELLGRGLVREAGQVASGGGRPATILELDPAAGSMIGVQLGVDFISVVLADFTGQISWQRLEDADPLAGQDAVLDQTLRLVEEAMAASNGRLLGLGLATPGTVDVEQGLLIFSPNLQWHNVPFRRIFQERTGLEIFVDNDANAAALAEHFYGVARQAQDFIFVFAGVGVGGGLFLRGELYRGASGFAGEIGHTNYTLEPYRAPCRCGNRGCWETSSNQYALIERVRARLSVRRNSQLSQMLAAQDVPLGLPIILEAAAAGDSDVLEALGESGSALGLGVANLINIFNPEMVVIGGPLAAAGTYLLPTIEAMVEKTVLPEIRAQAQIVLSAFGTDASVIGAVALVVEAILDHPSSVDPRSKPGAPSRTAANLR